MKLMTLRWIVLAGLLAPLCAHAQQRPARIQPGVEFARGQIDDDLAGLVDNILTTVHSRGTRMQLDQHIDSFMQGRGSNSASLVVQTIDGRENIAAGDQL